MPMIMIFRRRFGTGTEAVSRKPSTPLTIYFVRPKFKNAEILFTFEAGPNIGQLNDSLKGLYRLQKIGAY